MGIDDIIKLSTSDEAVRVAEELSDTAVRVDEGEEFVERGVSELPIHYPTSRAATRVQELRGGGGVVHSVDFRSPSEYEVVFTEGRTQKLLSERIDEPTEPQIREITDPGRVEGLDANLGDMIESALDAIFS